MLDEVIAHNLVAVEDKKEDVVTPEIVDPPKKGCC